MEIWIQYSTRVSWMTERCQDAAGDPHKKLRMYMDIWNNWDWSIPENNELRGRMWRGAHRRQCFAAKIQWTTKTTAQTDSIQATTRRTRYQIYRLRSSVMRDKCSFSILTHRNMYDHVRHTQQNLENIIIWKVLLIVDNINYYLCWNMKRNS